MSKGGQVEKKEQRNEYFDFERVRVQDFTYKAAKLTPKAHFWSG